MTSTGGCAADPPRLRLGAAAAELCEKLQCRVPVVLAGMGGVSRSELVGAVSEAGGFGFLGMVREPASLIWREVESLRERGYRNFGVNIIPAATSHALLEQQIDTIVELHVPVVALFWDIDERVVARFRDAGIMVVYQVGSVDEAIAAERAGAEILVAQGVEAGGHVRGVRPLGTLLPAIVAAVRTPVLAAGGLASGGDLVTALALGGSGIMLGTALMATDESFAHAYHKQRLLAATGNDTVLTDAFHINWPPGAPVRVLKSEVTDGRLPPDRVAPSSVIGAEEGRPIYLNSTDSPLRSMTGDFAAMALYAGTGVGRVDQIVPAARRIATIGQQAEAMLRLSEAEEVPETSSAVCYMGEFCGAYAGTLDEAEQAAELGGLAASLEGLLRASLPLDANGEPPFPTSSHSYAAWVLALRGLAGRTARPATTAATPAAIAERLTLLIPQMPEGYARQVLLKLRGTLDAENAIHFTRALQLAGSRDASGR